jgi:hypothetical protein
MMVITALRPGGEELCRIKADRFSALVGRRLPALSAIGFHPAQSSPYPASPL